MSTVTETKSVLQNTLAAVLASSEFRRVYNEIKRGARVVSISGLIAGPARALALAALQRETGKQFALVVPAQRDLESWERDVTFWYCALRGISECGAAVAALTASESDPYAGGSPHAQTLEKRALALWRLARRANVPPAIHAQPTDFRLLTSRALARRTIAPAQILRAGAVLRRDEDHTPEELVGKLIASGYLREDPVGAIGEFSMRGGILDVWSPGWDAPVRIEFFGDTVESIREFDPETQLSTTQLAQVEVAPMRELVVTTRDFRAWAEAARDRWSDERYTRALRDRTAFADEGEAFSDWEWLMSLVRERQSSVFDYLKKAVLVIDEPSGIESYLAEAYQTLADRFSETDAADDLGLAPDELYLKTEGLRARIDQQQRLELRTLGRAAADMDQALGLEAEAPKVQLGRTRSSRRPMFLFPTVEQ